MVELKQSLPQTQEEVPHQQERPQGQKGLQQTVDHLVLLLVKMNVRAAADQKTGRKNIYKETDISK